MAPGEGGRPRGSPRQGPVLRPAHSRPFVEYVAQPRRHAGRRSHPLFRLAPTTSLSGAQVTKPELPVSSEKAPLRVQHAGQGGEEAAGYGAAAGEGTCPFQSAW